MLRISIIVILSLIGGEALLAQNYRGKVVDIHNQPISYANVVLLKRQDSTFVEGCITDLDGFFSMTPTLQIADGLLKISCIGYKTAIIETKGLYDGNIQLSENTNELQEIVVKGSKPTYEMKGGALTAQVSGTILGNLGTASDVLKQMPLVSGNEDGFEVFGRGMPLIFINKRQVRNQNELKQLKSENIKDIQVNLNPGSQYSTEVDAVIEITTIKPLDGGLGGSLSLRGRQRKHFSDDEQLDLTYRNGNWDVFGMFYSSRNKREQMQKNENQFCYDSQPYNITEHGKIENTNKSLELSGGINYAKAQNYLWGLKYTYTETKLHPAYFDFQSELNNQNRIEIFSTYNDILQRGASHYINTYFRKEFSNGTSINADAVYTNAQNKRETTAYETEKEIEVIVPSKNTSESDLYAYKMWGDLMLLGGRLELGTEGTQTLNEQEYLMQNEELQDVLPSSEIDAKQYTASIYASYSKKWENMSLNLGVRYEYVDFNYFSNGVKDDNSSKKYNDLFPSLSVAYNKNRFSIAASYRTTIRKPTYQQLRSHVNYNNKYSYEGGNPSLQKNVNHNLNLTMRYGDISFDCIYRYRKEDIMLVRQYYKERPVILTSFMNHDRHTLDFTVLYSPSISAWKPTLNAGVSLQKLRYEGKDYNKPIFKYGWRNIISFPHNWMLTFNLEGQSHGDSQLASKMCNFNSDLSIKKSYKGIDIYIGAVDLFNTYRDRWAMKVGDIYYNKWNNPDNRCVYLRTVFTFNKASNKYKGGTAGESERSRL